MSARPPRRILATAYAGLVYFFLYAPIAVLVAYSFNDSRFATVWTGFTFKWYGRLATNTQLLDGAFNSLLVAVAAASLATVIGSLAAVAIYRYRFYGRTILRAVVFIMTVSPDIVMGISLLMLFMAARIPLGFWTLLCAHVTFCIPFVTITVLGRLNGFDEHIVEAAQDLGASESVVFRHILLPLVFPAVAAGWLLSFTLSLDDVMVSFFVTGPGFEILPLKIYSMVKLGVKPEVNALCAILLAATFAVVLSAQAILADRRKK